MTARSASSPANRDLLSTSSTQVPPAAQELVGINSSWTSYHASDHRTKLEAAGFVRLNERDEWNLIPGGKYFFTRNMSSIVAFAVGAKYVPGNGIHIVNSYGFALPEAETRFLDYQEWFQK